MFLTTNIFIIIFFLGSFGECIQYNSTATIAKLEDPGCKILNLSNQNMTKADAEGLAPYLKTSQIISLNLAYNEIGDDGLGEIFKILNYTQIESLNLEHTYMHYHGTLALTDVLPNTKITSLDLSNNLIIEQGIQYFAKTLDKTGITTLNLRSIQQPVNEVFGYLKNSSIESLDLSSNWLKAKDAETLARGLKGSRITYLDLLKNSLQDEGAKAIAKVLPETRITNLILIDNDIKFQGILEVAKMLKYTRIDSLNIAGNPIGNHGGEIVAELKNSLITSLDISWTDLGGDGLVELFSGLNETQITSLKISETSSGDLGDMIRGINNTQVTSLEVYLGKENNESANSLKSVVEGNKLRMDKIYQQFKNFVLVENDSLELNVSFVNANEIEFIEFYKRVEEKKASFIKYFDSKGGIYTRKQLMDFIENIELRMKEAEIFGIYKDLNNSPLGLCNGTYQEFEKFVTYKDGSLKFDIGYLNKEKSKFDELYKIIAKYKRTFLNYCVPEYPSDGVKYFIANIESRVEEAGIYVHNIANGLGNNLIVLCVITLLSIYVQGLDYS